MTTVHPPIHMPPHVHDRRADKLPDVLCIQCNGPVGTKPFDTDGTTPMSFERRTVFRWQGETDDALWQRVQLVVKAFKDRYGWNQPVHVVCDYDATVLDGESRRQADDLVNLDAALAWAAASDRSPRVRTIAAMALAQLRGYMRTGR